VTLFPYTTLFRSSSVIDNSPGVVETACSREEIVLLVRAIDQLPARCREIVILRKLKGIPQKIIAAQLGISEQTVQVQVARGMKRCDQYLREYGVRRSSDHGTE
jgi:RNA polymerase sigma-70 factor (ECF subfamily)